MATKPNFDPSVLALNPRASVSAWLRYAPIIYRAYASHPTPYTYTPVHLSAATVVSRLRDAVRGAIAFHHPSDIPTSDLESWYSQIVIVQRGPAVILGLPHSLHTPVPLTPPPAPNSKVDRTFPTLSLSELTSFCILLSNETISTSFSITSPPPDWSTLPPLYPNVSLILQPDQSLIVF